MKKAKTRTKVTLDKESIRSLNQVQGGKPGCGTCNDSCASGGGASCNTNQTCH